MVKGKQKTTVFFTPSVRRKIEDTYRIDNCKSQSEFIEKAVEFYLGYLNTKNAGAFLPEVLSTILIGITDDLAQRMGRYLYKVAVEQYLCNHILTADTDMDQRTYELMSPTKCSAPQRQKSIKGLEDTLPCTPLKLRPANPPPAPFSPTRVSGASQAPAVSARSTTICGRAATPPSGQMAKNTPAMCTPKSERNVRNCWQT